VVDAPDLSSRFLGTILGLAVGDALGAPVEFSRRGQILERYGLGGIKDLDSWDGFPAGYYTDDTQMSLATAAGLLRGMQDFDDGGVRPVLESVYRSYLEWRATQDDPQQRRAPGRTCLSALDSGRMGSIEDPINNSKGCGGVMRAAPVGLALAIDDLFALGAECAAITHGHPSGYLSAGYLSELIAWLVRGVDLETAVRATRHSLVNYDGYEETLGMVDRALELADSSMRVPEAIGQLGEGWVGEEALAIALFAALRHSTDWKAATLAAVNHSGDSDSTGSICGAILGAALGVEAIPARWIAGIENRALLEKTAADMYAAFVASRIPSS
jgi:ADP-ribosylglycohydrolase